MSGLVEFLSPHFKRTEVERSQEATRLGLSNRIPDDLLTYWKMACQELLEPLRTVLGVPITINSGYRSHAVNAAIGGSNNSQHRGQWIPKDKNTPLPCVAFDLILSETPPPADRTHAELSNLVLFETVLSQRNGLPVDQIIWEFGEVEPDWVHISYVPSPQPPRRQVIKASRVAGKVVYVPYSHA